MKFDGILGLGRVKEAVVRNASFIQNLRYDVKKIF
jgi:cathepsin D